MRGLAWDRMLLPVLLAWPAAADMAFPGDEWERVAPEAEGLDAARLEAAVRYLEENTASDGAHELAIIRNGRMVHAGDRINKVHGIWSATKSFTSTCLGLLIDDGRCTLDTRAAEALPELNATYPELTLRHFTTMTSGYRAMGDEPRGGYSHGPSVTPLRPSPEPLFAPPGSQYAYWDSAMNEFAHVLTRIAGEPLDDLFMRRIGEPIGIDPAEWNWGRFELPDGAVVNCGSGNNGKHVRTSARQVARLGHLFLNRGNWRGAQLLSEEWIGQATSVQVAADVPLAHEESGIAGPGQYGFNWWVNGDDKWPGAPEGAFAASGYNNNDMFVIPEWGMVIVRLGLDEGELKIIDEVYGRFIEMVGEALR